MNKKELKRSVMGAVSMMAFAAFAVALPVQASLSDGVTVVKAWADGDGGGDGGGGDRGGDGRGGDGGDGGEGRDGMDDGGFGADSFDRAEGDRGGDGGFGNDSFDAPAGGGTGQGNGGFDPTVPSTGQ